MLMARAEGGHPDNARYRAIRQELLEDPEIEDLLPGPLRSHRNLDDFWGFIKLKFGRYAERREYLRQQFEPLFAYLEGGDDSGPQGPAPKPARSTAPAASSSEPPRPKDLGAERRVFLVHGHDTGPREAIARFIEKIGLEAVILEEQPN